MVHFSYIYLLVVVYLCESRAKDVINIVLGLDEGSIVPFHGVSKAIKSFSRPEETIKDICLTPIVVSRHSKSDVCTKIFEGSIPPTVILDATSKGNDLRSFARTVGIPFVRAAPGRGPDCDGFGQSNDGHQENIVNLMVPGDIIATSVKDLIAHYQLKAVVVLHDRYFDIDEDTVLGLGSSRVLSFVGEIADDYKQQLNEFRNEVHLNYFILGSLKTINNVLSAAKENNMLRSHYRWFVITKSKGTLNCSDCINEKMMLLQPMASTLHEYDVNVSFTSSRVDSYFYFDLTRIILETISNAINSSQWHLNTTAHQCSGQGMATRSKWTATQIGFRHQLAEEAHGFNGKYGDFVIGSNDTCGYQDIGLNIMKLVSGKEHVAPTKVAQWAYDRPAGSIMFKSGLYSASGASGQKKKVRIVTVVHPPYVMKKLVNATGCSVNRYRGYLIDLLDEIQKELGTNRMEFEICEQEQGLFGTMKNGNYSLWDGAMGDLIRGKADLALAPMSILAERQLMISFTTPIMSSVGIVILMKKPKRISHFYKFLTVLEKNVWICILGAYVFTSILLHVFDKFSPYSYRNVKKKIKLRDPLNDLEDDEDKRVFTLKESFWFCITSLTPQGGGEAPRNLSGRLVAATWWLFGFIIIASYTANLAAFLTVSRLETSIKDLKELSKQYKVKYAPLLGTGTSVYFERMAGIEEVFYETWKDMSLNDSASDDDRAKLAVWDYPISDRFTKIWSQMIEAGFPNSFEEAIKRVKESRGHKDGFALLTDEATADYALLTNCDLHRVGDPFSQKSVALGLKRGSPLKELLDPVIVRLMDKRVTEDLYYKWWDGNRDRKVCEDTRKRTDGIALRNAGGVFLVIGVGIIVTVVVLFLENSYYKRQLQKEEDGNRVTVFRPDDDVADQPKPEAKRPFWGNLGRKRKELKKES